MALIVLGLLSLVVWKQSKPTAVPKETRLSDGSRIRINELTYGTNITFGKASIWQKLLGHLPPKLQPNNLRLPTIVTLQTPSTVLIYSVVRPGTNSNNPLNFRLVDEHGNESSGGGSTTWSGQSGTNMLQARIFSSAPRRSKTIKLKIFDGIHTPAPALLGELTFDNRIQSQAPPLTALPLPQSQKVGDMTVRLLDAAYGLKYGEGEATLWQDSKQNSTFLKLDFLTGSILATNWTVTSVVSSDATGNVLPSNTLGGYQNGSDYLIWFRDSLWPVEPIRYTLEIGKLSGWSSNELLVMNDVPIPAKGGFTAIGLTTNRLGQRIDVEGFVDAGVVPPWRIDNRWNGSPSLHVTLPLLAKGTHIKVLSVVDDLGRECPTLGTVSSDSEFAYGLNFPKGGKTATIRLAIQKSVRVEFITKPRVETGKASRF